MDFSCKVFTYTLHVLTAEYCLSHSNIFSFKCPSYHLLQNKIEGMKKCFLIPKEIDQEDCKSFALYNPTDLTTRQTSVKNHATFYALKLKYD